MATEYMKIKRNKKTGLTEGLLQDRYSSFEEFENFDEIYSLAARLGFKNAKGCWRVNPMVQSGINPADFKRIKK